MTDKIKRNTNQHNEVIEYDMKFDNEFSLYSSTKYPLPVVIESFQLQMGFSFSFLRVKYLPTSLLIVRTRSFFTLLYGGGTYTQVQGGGQSPPPYILTPLQLSEGQGFSNYFFPCWTSLSVASSTKCMHVTETITKDKKGRGR